MWNTRITEMLGCKYPIIQGAYGAQGTSAIAAPVSAAGGFGIITAGSHRTPEDLAKDIHRCREMTDQPFGVNLSVGICPRIEEMCDVCIEEKIGVVFTSAYDGRALGYKLQAAGIKWIHKCATVRHAISTERQGADAVVIVGLDGTGHKSPIQLPTMINIPLALKTIKIPVIAAGGIGDARTFLAVLAMGAEAAYLGTSFMATAEFPAPDSFKQKLVETQGDDPELRALVLRPPAQQSQDRLKEWQRPLTPEEEAERDRRFSSEYVWRFNGSFATAFIDSVPTCKEFIDSMIHGAEEILASNNPVGAVARGLAAKSV